MRARPVVMLLVGLLVGGTVSAARAADEDPDAWHVTVTPYAWAPGIYGDVTVRGVTAEVDASFLDLLDKTDTLVGLDARLEVTRGRFGVFGDIFYTKTEIEDAGITGLDVETRMWFIEFGAQYRVLDTRDDRVPGFTVDVYGGGRYSFLELDLDTAGAPSANQSKDWIDPIVGARVGVHFSPQRVPAVRRRRRRLRCRLRLRVVGHGALRLQVAVRHGRVGHPRGIQGAGPGLHDRLRGAALPLGHHDARSRAGLQRPLLARFAVGVVPGGLRLRMKKVVVRIDTAVGQEGGRFIGGMAVVAGHPF